MVYLTSPVLWFFSTGTRNLVRVRRRIGITWRSTLVSGPSMSTYKSGVGVRKRNGGYAIFIENVENNCELALVLAVVDVDCAADFDEMLERLGKGLGGVRKGGLTMEDIDFGVGFSFLAIKTI